MFLEVAREVARKYEGKVTWDDRIVDACAMQLVLNPWQYDVIVTTNLFGDILSDLAAGARRRVGDGAPEGNLVHCTIFEAVHSSAPDITGKGNRQPRLGYFSAGWADAGACRPAGFAR